MDLAVMREKAHEEKEDVSHVLLAWKGLDKELRKNKVNIYFEGLIV